MFSSWYKKLLGNPVPPNRRVRRATRTQLGFEHLEDRTVPTFLGATSIGTGLATGGVAVGDYNGDGKQDIAVVNQTLAGSVGIMLSNGDGTFQPMVSYAAGTNPIDAKAGDFNGDGKLDLAVVSNSTINILLGNGDGTFSAPSANTIGFGGHSVNVGDFNNDGKLDVATFASGFANVLLGNGDGTFQAHRDAAYTGNSTNTVVGDFNHDGFLDLATSNTVSIGTVTILRGHGDGTFDLPSNYYAYSAPVYLDVGDFNGDGYPDLVCPNSYSATSMSVLMNNGDGTYAAPHTYSIPQTGYEIEVADFNGDGKQDFAVRGATTYMVSLGKGDGTFYPNVNYATPAGRFQSGTHGDFNGDGAIDLAYPNASGVTVVMNAHDDVSSLAGAVGYSVSMPSSTTGGSSLPMTVTAVDAAGNVATGFRGTVYVNSSDPAAPTGLSYTFTAADAGTHSFGGSIQLVTAGPQTITVTSPFMTPFSGSVMVTAPVSRYGVSAPTSSTAGDTLNVTVSALDNAGNVGAGYTSTVHFTSSDLLAGLPADYTFTSADAGVHTFSATLKTAGVKNVSVSEVAGVINGTSNITVTPAATTKLTLAGGGGAIGVARPITIAAQDVYGNVGTGYTGTVNFTSSDAAAVLPANVALVNGVATVNVTFMTVGTQTVTATDVTNSLIFGTMSSNATPPVAALFAVTGYPATTAGVAHTFTVTVRDTIGQIATGFTGTVYFTSSDWQAGLPASYTFTAADAGVHTFSAAFKTTGTQSITARDMSGLLMGSQAGITVSAGAFAGFRLSVPNGTDSKGHVLVAAGDAISLRVQVVDAFGNTITGYRGKVKFTSTDVQAGLPTDYNFTTADAGIHTFTVVLKTSTPNAVVWSMSVVDASSAATLATLTNFEVTNGAAAKFVLSVPSNITVGTPFTLKVNVLDAYGNTVTNYFGTIHFANTAGIAGLPADYTFGSLDKGVHSFTVTLSTLGSQTISIADLASPALTSSVIVIVNTTGGGVAVAVAAVAAAKSLNVNPSD